MASHNKTSLLSNQKHERCITLTVKLIISWWISLFLSFLFNLKVIERNVDKFLLQKLPPYLLLYHAGLPANGRSLSLPLKISESCQIYLTSPSMYCLYSPNILIVATQEFCRPNTYLEVNQICIFTLTKYLWHTKYQKGWLAIAKLKPLSLFISLF